MAEKATDVISAEEAREVLRLPQDSSDNTHNKLIQGQLKGAVSWCSRIMGRPILPRTRFKRLLPGQPEEVPEYIHLGHTVKGSDYHGGDWGGRISQVQGSYTRSDPLVIAERDLKRVDSIIYWSDQAEQRDEPDGEVPTADLGHLLLQANDPWEHEQHPPADGWPAILGGTFYKVTFTSFIDDEYDGWPSIQEGVRFALYHNYHGMPRLEINNTLTNILSHLIWE